MKTDSPVCVYAGDALAAYGFGEGHPFGPDRFHAFWDYFVGQGMHERVKLVDPVRASRDDLLLFHTEAYVRQVEVQSRTGFGSLDGGDTPAFAGMYEAACCVVGTALLAAESIIEGRCRRAFVPIAGLHHARRDGAAGFCIFNDCGVVIEAMRARHGIRRVAYVDIDAHHGDGVFYAFESDPDLIFADIHEDGRYLYPGTGRETETGRGEAVGSKLNVPMPPNADDAIFGQVWPAVESFVRKAEPEFILFQCGADSVGGDPITHLRYTVGAHARAAEALCAVADEVCGGRILGVGGGGYNRGNLARAWTEVIRAFVEAGTRP